MWSPRTRAGTCPSRPNSPARSPAPTTCSRSWWTRAACRCRRSASAAARPAWTSSSPAASTGTCGCGCSPRCSWPTCSPGPPTYWGPSPASTSSAPSTRPRPSTPRAPCWSSCSTGRGRSRRRPLAVTADSPGTSTARLSLTGFGPVGLWSPDHPRLYTVQATLNFPGIGRHTLSRRIGFREASFRPDGFFLNGKRLQLFGLNRHQLYPYAGMAMGARAQRKDAEILKNEFNCNMVRCSHYPQSPAFLDACDELGLLVWEEAPGWHNVSTTGGLAGRCGAGRQGHGDQGPEPSLGDHLGHPAERMQGLPRAVGRDQAGRAGAGQHPAEFRRDGLPRGPHLERGRLRLQRLRDRRQDRERRAQAALSRAPLPGLRGGRRRGGQAAALRLDGPAGLAGPSGRHARPGAEPGAVQPRVRRPAGLGRVRLRLAARPGPVRHQVGRGGGRLPGAQARRRHLPDPGRPGRTAGHRPGVLLGGPRRGSRTRLRPR